MDNHGFLFQIGFRYFPFIPFFIFSTVAFCLSVWAVSIFLSFVLLFMVFCVFLLHTYVRTMTGGF